MDVIRSSRLDLISMGPALLEALLEGDRHRAMQVGGFDIADDLVIAGRTLQMRLRQLSADPGLQPWLLRAVVVRESQMMCGRIGFHSRPGPPDLRDVAADGVEMGYAIAPSWRRQGLAREAALALMKWALETHGQRCFILSIAPDNAASLALARSMGFTEIGSHIDPEDGIELYLERRIDHWPDE